MTTKQMGDACEMLLAAEMTLRGIPTTKMPDNWPHYDVIAQPPDGGKPQRISVKSRTFKTGSNYVEFLRTDDFDWLAIIFLTRDPAEPRQFFLIPRELARETARKPKVTAKNQNLWWWSQQEVPVAFARFKNNFCLSLTGSDSPPVL
jgi:hypothetical protein